MTRRKRFTRNLGRTLPAPAPVRVTVEWIRFEHEVEPYGVFSYLSDARKSLPADALRELDTLMAWFEERLGAPEQADRERFWFRAEADEHITRARRVTEIVRAAGIPIVERRTRRVPGKARWADADQVAVITFRDAPRSRKGPP